MTPRRLLALAALLLVVVWLAAPGVRGVLLVRPGGCACPVAVHGEAVSFRARDGVLLRGTFVPAAGTPSGTVILVHGFKSGRNEMAPWVQLLQPAYDVLAYDGRGTGESEGTFGVGATEPRDILGAVDLIVSRHGAGAAHIAVLGISLGAGDALLAAAEDPRIAAVVADSAWADERVQLARMGSLPVGPLAIPVVPYEAALVDLLIGGRLEDARPIDAVARIAPRALLLIHSADDGNATTPPADAERLLAAAGAPKSFWLVPQGGHVGAIRAQPAEYARRVLEFLATALR